MLFKAMRLPVILSLFLLSTACVGQRGNGKVVKKDYPVSNFTALHISNAFEVHVRQGNTTALTIVTDENLQDQVEVDVSGGTLHLSMKGVTNHATELKAYITITELDEIDISGACELETANTIKGTSLNLDISGASEVDMDLDFREVHAEASGASEVDLSGKAGSLELHLSGASEWNSEELLTAEVMAELSGASDADVYASERLTAEASGASSLEHLGSPKEVNRDVSGAATVTSK